MKTFSSSLSTEKASLNTASCYAVELLSPTPVRICNWDQSITFDGDTYTGGTPIQKPSLRSGYSGGGTVKIGNVDGAFTSLFINGTLKQVEISIYEIFLDGGNAVVGGETLFTGKVDGQGLDDYWCVLTLAPFTDGSLLQGPRRRLVPSCGFVFKSTECGYSGSETSCSKTYEGCHNKSRFGGFRFIPRPGKVFAWGKTIITVR